MKVILALVLMVSSQLALAGVFSSFTEREYKYRSQGRWNDNAGEKGTWTGETTYTVVDDSTLKVDGKTKINDGDNIVEMTTTMSFKESSEGFIDVLNKDGAKVGTGYCQGPACHYTYEETSDEGAHKVEETIKFRHHHKQFKLIGSHTAPGDAGKITAWSGRGRLVE